MRERARGKDEREREKMMRESERMSVSEKMTVSEDKCEPDYDGWVSENMDEWMIRSEE